MGRPLGDHPLAGVEDMRQALHVVLEPGAGGHGGHEGHGGGEGGAHLHWKDCQSILSRAWSWPVGSWANFFSSYDRFLGFTLSWFLKTVFFLPKNRFNFSRQLPPLSPGELDGEVELPEVVSVAVDVVVLHGEAGHVQHPELLRQLLRELGLVQGGRPLHHHHLAVVLEPLGGAVYQGGRVVELDLRRGVRVWWVGLECGKLGISGNYSRGFI